jgi:hypothetical protein
MSFLSIASDVLLICKVRINQKHPKLRLFEILVEIFFIFPENVVSYEHIGLYWSYISETTQ